MSDAFQMFSPAGLATAIFLLREQGQRTPPCSEGAEVVLGLGLHGMIANIGAVGAGLAAPLAYSSASH